MAERRPKKRHHRLHSNTIKLLEQQMKLLFTLCKAVHQSFHAVGSFLVHYLSHVVCVYGCAMCSPVWGTDWKHFRCVQTNWCLHQSSQLTGCNMRLLMAKEDIEIQPGFEPGSSEFRSDALTNELLELWHWSRG